MAVNADANVDRNRQVGVQLTTGDFLKSRIFDKMVPNNANIVEAVRSLIAAGYSQDAAIGVVLPMMGGPKC